VTGQVKEFLACVQRVLIKPYIFALNIKSEPLRDKGLTEYEVRELEKRNT
jgi:hypothetical protein